MKTTDNKSHCLRCGEEHIIGNCVLYEHRPEWMDTFAYKLRLAMSKATPTRTELAARTRYKDREGISIKELAARSGITEQRIRNILYNNLGKRKDGSQIEVKQETKKKLLENC